MAPIPIRSIGATTFEEEPDDLIADPISTSLTLPTYATGDRLLAAVVVNGRGAPNDKIPLTSTPSGWTLLETSQDATIGGASRTTTTLYLFERIATGTDTCSFTVTAPSGTTEMDDVAFIGFVVACRGEIPQVDIDEESGLANNIDPTNSYTIDSHPTAPGGSLMFAAARNVNPLNMETGSENGMAVRHTATGDGVTSTWSTLSMAQGSTTPTTADSAQWDVTSGGVQWGTIFVTYGPSRRRGPKLGLGFS